MFLPQLRQKAAQQAVTQIFGGINRAERIGDGEFSRAMNLSTREYPLLCPRKARGRGEQIDGVYRGMLAKNGKLVTIIDNRVDYGGETVAGITLSEDESMLPKQMVSMGAYVVIFPDKVYFNSIDPSDHGSLEAEYESAGTITYTMCRLDGSDYGNVETGETPPEEPENGDYWINTGTTPHQLMIYSALNETWTQIMTVYTRISAAGISSQFQAGDTVEISGISAGSGTIKEQTEALNGSQYIYGAGDGWITVLGVLDGTATQESGSVTIQRKCPDMEYVVEESNRLWGCHYGQGADGQMLNEIYACKLGDFKNWRVYQGISTDSYAVSIGSDGPFTGAISFGGMPMFFKRDCVHKLYGNKPANYQVLTTQLHGVQPGSGKSLCSIGSAVLYLSEYGIEAYDGSQPAKVSQALGDNAMSAGVAGVLDGKYYIDVTENEERHLYVYDPARSIWQEEDTEGIQAFAAMGSDLYMQTRRRIDTAMGTEGKSEGLVAWWAETGLQGWEQYSSRVMGAADSKYISKYQIRAALPVGSRLKCLIQYDGKRGWQEKLNMENAWSGRRTVNMPVYPRRCDHLKMRLEGTGEIMLYSITRSISSGGDGHHG